MIERPPTPWKRYGGYFGAVVLGVAAWQVLSPKKEDQPAERPRTEMSSQLAAKGTLPASSRTKPEPQAALPATPVARAPGMLDEEIRMVVEDYRKTLSLDPASENAGAEMRQRQEQWYLASLTEALGLNEEQVAQARENLRKTGDRILHKQGNAAPIEESLRWWTHEGYAPWSLCELTPDQSKLTIKNEIFSVPPPLYWLSTKDLPLSSGDSLLAFARTLSPGQLMLGLFIHPPWGDALLQELDGKAPPEPEPLAVAPAAPPAVAPVSTRETPAPVQPTPPEVPPETAEPAQGDEPTEPEE